MKKNYCLLIFCLIINFSFAQEILPNPGFENWVNTAFPYPTGWNCAYCSKGTPHSGNYSVQINIPSTASSEGMNTDNRVLNIVAGKTYNISYWYNTSSADMKAIYLNVYKSGGGSRFLYNANTALIKDGQWHQATTSFTADISDLGKCTVDAATTYGVAGSIMIDDISMKDSALMAVSEVDYSKSITFQSPVSSSLRYKSSEKVTKIEIFSSDGRLVKTVFRNNEDLSSLTKGIYILKTTFSNGAGATTKVVKK